MAKYKVQSDGKAQKGLKAGDEVVTGGGTYKITGVNSDGTYKSEKVNNETTSTYKGSYANSSGGGGYSSGSGGGSNKSSGNSQYTNVNLGNTWDANTDYQAIINNAVATGDYVTAAKAEQLRNQKITATGGHYNLTNDYKGWLDNTDYSTKMWEGMKNGMSAEEMQALYNGRYGKADGTIGLERYKDDNLMQIAQNYINQQQFIEQQQAMLDQWEQENPKEDYESKYDPKIEALLSEILNREDFSYNAMNDPLYQQYAESYRREGDRAMRDTLAEVAAGAGGMNSYAITAAQQANSYYNSQLNDKIPELYQLAYEMYLNDKESKVQDLGILQNMDATQYNRYRDTINDWYNDKNFAYGSYMDAVNQGNWQTNFNNQNFWANKEFDYNDMWKNKEFDYNDMWANKEWDEQQSDKEYDRNLYDQESAKEEVWRLIELGVTPNADLIKKAGMSDSDVSLAVAAVKAQQAKTGGKSSGSGIRSSDDGYTGGDDDEDKKKVEDDDGYTGNDDGEKPGNYEEVLSGYKEMIARGDEWGAAAYAKEALDAGMITNIQYNVLLRMNNPLLDTFIKK